MSVTELKILRESLEALQAQREIARLKRQVSRLEAEVKAPPDNKPVETVSDFFGKMMQEQQDFKDGIVDEKHARVVDSQNRSMLRTIEMQIQYSRLHKGKHPDPEMRLIAKGESK
jgi:hypothetical protein